MHELIIEKQFLTEKKKVMADLHADLLGQSFMFCQTSETWLKKRKATSQAFYRQQLE